MDKPGFKTSEFWLTLAATVVGMLIASGAFADATAVGKVLAFAASVLGGLGYTWSRASVKKSASLVEAAKLQIEAAKLDPKPVASRGKR